MKRITPAAKRIAALEMAIVDYRETLKSSEGIDMAGSFLFSENPESYRIIREVIAKYPTPYWAPIPK